MAFDKLLMDFSQNRWKNKWMRFDYLWSDWSSCLRGSEYILVQAHTLNHFAYEYCICSWVHVGTTSCTCLSSYSRRRRWHLPTSCPPTDRWCHKCALLNLDTVAPLKKKIRKQKRLAPWYTDQTHLLKQTTHKLKMMVPHQTRGHSPGMEG